MAKRFDDVSVFVFDAYGTLFDVHSAVRRHDARLGPAAAEVSALWRVKQLEYTWLRSLMGAWKPFAGVTADALDYALDSHGVEDAGLRADLLEAYYALSAYPEVAGMLQRVKQAGFAAAILSNGDPDMLDRSVASAGIGASLDAVLSVAPLGIYKPHPHVYALACTRFGVPPAEIAFVSANAWDAAGAARFGFRVIWCNRFGQKPERLGAAPACEVADLNGLPWIAGAA